MSTATKCPVCGAMVVPAQHLGGCPGPISLAQDISCPEPKVGMARRAQAERHADAVERLVKAAREYSDQMRTPCDCQDCAECRLAAAVEAAERWDQGAR